MFRQFDFKSFCYALKYKALPAAWHVRIRYFRYFRRFPNLSNPRLFSEKIQWLKLNYKNTLLTICADKYRVRDFVKQQVGEEFLIPMVFRTISIDDITTENFPDYPVVIKTTHDSSGVIVVKDKRDFDFYAVRKEIRQRLRQNYYLWSKEWAYKDIEPSIIVEKLVHQSLEKVLLNDYKVYCFNGKPEFIQVITERDKKGFRDIWYDFKWNKLNLFGDMLDDRAFACPSCLEEMYRISTVLSRFFPFVRVDLYVVENRVYFGELTFYPFSGMKKNYPKEIDTLFGQRLKLDIE